MARIGANGEKTLALPSVRELGYCSNVHAVRDVGGLKQALRQHAVPLAAEFGRPFPVGLWLPRSALAELDAAGRQRFARWLAAEGLRTTTFNAFPFGDFHAAAVKKNVYLPDWTAPERLQYTLDAAELLAACLPERGAGSVSTLPLGYRTAFPKSAWPAALANLRRLADGLAALGERTGKTIRAAIEPEPGCALDRTEHVVQLFAELERPADREHLGVCFDVCHAAVMGEAPGAAIAALHAAGIRIPKVQLSSALELADPRDPVARRYLTQFAEPRYLHQVAAGTLFLDDLAPEFALAPPPEWLAAGPWRVHFHVPVNRATVGPLGTTAGDALVPALRALHALPYEMDVEVETYTWGVLPDEDADLVSGLADEVREIRRLASIVGAPP